MVIGYLIQRSSFAFKFKLPRETLFVDQGSFRDFEGDSRQNHNLEDRPNDGLGTGEVLAEIRLVNVRGVRLRILHCKLAQPQEHTFSQRIDLVRKFVMSSGGATHDVFDGDQFSHPASLHQMSMTGNW